MKKISMFSSHQYVDLTMSSEVPVYGLRIVMASGDKLSPSRQARNKLR